MTLRVAVTEASEGRLVVVEVIVNVEPTIWMGICADLSEAVAVMVTTWLL